MHYYRNGYRKTSLEPAVSGGRHGFQLTFINYIVTSHENFNIIVTFVPDTLLFQVAALFHIGTTKSHPPIPEHLSAEAKDFLLKCLQKYV